MNSSAHPRHSAPERYLLGRTLIKLLRRVVRTLLFGGGRALRGYENAIVQAVSDHLSAEDRKTFTQQIDARERVQRWNSDRIVLFGFADRSLQPKLSLLNEDYCLARIAIRSGRETVTAALVIHRGVVSTIEFSKSPKRAQTESFRVERVVLHPKNPDYSQAVDAEEHGVPRPRRRRG